MELFDSDVNYRGDRLKLARVAKGLSCEDLASALGKTKQFISKLERGFKPSDILIDELAEYLEVDSNFFFSERRYPLDSEQCHFRSKKSRTQTLTNCILARAEVLDTLLSILEEEVEFPTLDIPDVSDMTMNSANDIERIAESCRRYWGLGLGPISSMANLVERIGVVVAHVSGVDDRVDAFTVHNKRPLIIRNNAKKSICRFRSDLGHELGHLVLHEGIITGDKLTEMQADHFSSAFLVPRISFINEFPKMRGSQFDWGAMVRFKERWKISLRMGLYRASVLGVITPEQARRGFIHLNSKGHVSIEMGDELIPVEEPSILSRSIDMIDSYTWQTILDKASLKAEFVKTLFSIYKETPDCDHDYKIIHLSSYKNFG
ncbi:Domain of uncharacterised function (DUF955) [Yersinia intermedia]|uniref:helix-turn-helix domain-containing protein n=1 Tax=Yersinia intermedia TaxID=631 RepID=UPI0005E11ED0|nr:XRE family transcriptional regulator [Yersinia intermedia]CQJ66055.1 Domain of uncharacterised function (DUF955) [Yersinia intermedia]